MTCEYTSLGYAMMHGYLYHMNIQDSSALTYIGYTLQDYRRSVMTMHFTRGFSKNHDRRHSYKPIRRLYLACVTDFIIIYYRFCYAGWTLSRSFVFSTATRINTYAINL